MNKIRQQSPLSEAKPARTDNQMEWATKNLNLDVKRTIDRGSLYLLPYAAGALARSK